MKVLIAHSQYRWRGGEESTVENQAEALRGLGIEVARFEVQNPSDAVRSAGALAVAGFNPGSYWAARRAIRAAKPDVIHIHNTWFRLSPSVISAAKHEGVPIAMTIQNFRFACPQAQFFRDGAPCTLCLGRFPFPGVTRACYRGSRLLTLWSGMTTSSTKQLLESVDRFVIPSEFARSKLVEAGLPMDRTTVIPNGVPDPGARPEPPSASGNLVFAGRLSSEKGLDILITAMRQIDSDVRLVVYGDGPDRERLEEEASSNVEFRGWVSTHELANVFRSSRALLFPSQWFEVCPLVILESYASGLPVLGSHLGSIRQLIDKVDSELLVVPDDAQEWYQAIQRLANGSLVDHAGQQARRVFELDFNLSRFGGALVDLYKELGV